MARNRTVVNGVHCGWVERPRGDGYRRGCKRKTHTHGQRWVNGTRGVWGERIRGYGGTHSCQRF